MRRSLLSNRYLAVAAGSLVPEVLGINLDPVGYWSEGKLMEDWGETGFFVACTVDPVAALLEPVGTRGIEVGGKLGLSPVVRRVKLDDDWEANERVEEGMGKAGCDEAGWV